MHRKYLAYARVSFIDLSVYKADYIVGIVSNMAFFFVYLALWKTIYAATGVAEVHNYTLVNTITYYLVTSFIFRFDISDRVTINNDVWTGYFTNDLVRPWNAKLAGIVYALCDMAFEVILYLPFWIFIWITCHQYLSMPTFPNALLFLATMILSLIMSFSFYLIWHSLVFYFGDQESNINLTAYIAVFLAGGMFPLAFLPDWAYRITTVLPFRFLFEVPANIFLGKIGFSGVVFSWLQIVLWAVFFYLISYFLFKNGLKRYAGEGR